MERLGTIFAKNMRDYRRKCGLTQEKLAELVNVSTHHIGMLELTKNFPSFDLIERIAGVFHIEMYELFVESPSLQKEFDSLRKYIKADMKQVVRETLQDIFTIVPKDKDKGVVSTKD